MTDISAELRTHRAQTGLTINETIRCLGMKDPKTYRAWEEGTRTPNGPVPDALAVLNETTTLFAALAAETVEDEFVTFRDAADIDDAYPGHSGLLTAGWHRQATGLSRNLIWDDAPPVRYWDPERPNEEATLLRSAVRLDLAEALLVESGFGRIGVEHGVIDRFIAAVKLRYPDEAVKVEQRLGRGPRG